MALVLRAEHSLSDVTATPWLGPRIPGGPPDYGDVDEKGDRRHPRGVEVGHEAQEGAARSAQFGSQRGSAAHGAHRSDPEHDDHSHLDEELEEVGYEDAP